MQVLGTERPARGLPGGAVALASVAEDVWVTRIANRVVGAHAVLPPGALR